MHGRSAFPLFALDDLGSASMKRLCDQPVLDAMDRQLADLFRVAERQPFDPFMKRRILVRLNRDRRLRTRRWAGVTALTLLIGTGVCVVAAREHDAPQSAGPSADHSSRAIATSSAATVSQTRTVDEVAFAQNA